jgi:hypothetical protein
MYKTEPDPYCYPGTTVLINRLGTRDQARLDAFEAEMTSDRATEPLPFGRLSYRHYPGHPSAPVPGRVQVGGEGSYGANIQRRQHLLLSRAYRP